MERRIRDTNGTLRVVLLASVAAALLGCGATSGESTTSVVPCGGDLVGVWAELDEDVTYPAPTNVNSCWNLMGSFSADGAYSAGSRYPIPQARRTILQFEPDGTYHGSITRFGPVTVNYAAECLVTDQGPPSCKKPCAFRVRVKARTKEQRAALEQAAAAAAPCKSLRSVAHSAPGSSILTTSRSPWAGP